MTSSLVKVIPFIYKKHWDLTEGDYVDNPTAEGYTWSNDTYRLESNF